MAVVSQLDGHGSLKCSSLLFTPPPLNTFNPATLCPLRHGQLTMLSLAEERVMIQVELQALLCHSSVLRYVVAIIERSFIIIEPIPPLEPLRRPYYTFVKPILLYTRRYVRGAMCVCVCACVLVCVRVCTCVCVWWVAHGGLWAFHSGLWIVRVPDEA